MELRAHFILTGLDEYNAGRLTKAEILSRIQPEPTPFADLHIAHGIITVAFFPDECALMATILDRTDTDDMTEESARLIRAWTVAFKAIAVAGGQSNRITDPEAAEALAEIGAVL